MSLSFPPFTRAVKMLVLANAVIFLLLALLRTAGSEVAQQAIVLFGLIPGAVTHGFVWQIVTYSFIHAGLFHVLFNMLALWMFGGTLERDWGTRQFLEFYFFCVIGAALVTIGVSYTGVLGLSPMQLTVGASGGVYGVLMAFGILYSETEVFMFPLPFTIKVKYMIAVLIFIALAGAVQEAGGIANFAHLGGLLFGFLYVRFLPRRGLGYLFSERYFGLRNRYYRWKRRRAARKFEVYMRKQDPDSNRQYFDEYGNYRGPGSDPEKRDGENRGPWVH